MTRSGALIVWALLLATEASAGPNFGRFRKNGASAPPSLSANGVACVSGGQCASGACIDSVCCNTGCSGSCAACSVATGASVDGTCAVYADANVGSPSCTPYLCDGSGASCPSTCAASADCAAGFVCVANACVADYFTSLMTSNPGTQCSGTVPTMSGGETLTITRASSAYCTASTGGMFLKTAGQSRVSNAGMLIEGPRTNYVLYSEELDNAAWSGSATITTNVRAPPWSASTLMDNVASVAISNRYQCPTASSTTAFATSGYARTAATQSVTLTNYCVGTSWATCGGYTDSTDYSGGAGGQQCTAAVDSTTTTGRITTWANCNGSETTTCLEVQGINSGNGNADWGGIQIEGGSFASSYIPTTGTAASRAADDVHFTPSQSMATEGCVSGTVTLGPKLPTGWVNLIGGETDDLVSVNSGLALFAMNDGTNGITLDPLATLARGTFNFRATWGGASMSLTVGAITETAAFDGAMSDVFTDVYLGSRGGTSQFLFGHLKNLKFGTSATGCAL